MVLLPSKYPVAAHFVALNLGCQFLSLPPNTNRQEFLQMRWEIPCGSYVITFSMGYSGDPGHLPLLLMATRVQ